MRQSKLSSLEIGSLPTGNVLKDERVVIAVDGGRTRIRINKKGRCKLKTNRVNFTGEWVEPKLLTIYTVNEHGKKLGHHLYVLPMMGHIWVIKSF